MFYVYLEVRPEADAIRVPEAAKLSISRTRKPSKEEVIARHSSRFRKVVSRELQFSGHDDNDLDDTLV